MLIGVAEKRLCTELRTVAAAVAVALTVAASVAAATATVPSTTSSECDIPLTEHNTTNWRGANLKEVARERLSRIIIIPFTSDCHKSTTDAKFVAIIIIIIVRHPNSRIDIDDDEDEDDDNFPFSSSIGTRTSTHCQFRNVYPAAIILLLNVNEYGVRLSKRYVLLNKIQNNNRIDNERACKSSINRFTISLSLSLCLCPTISNVQMGQN